MQTAEIMFYPDGNKTVSLMCESASTFFSKIKGLMNKSSLDGNKGMLFTFWFSWYRIFWMKNVRIPLDIIFINKDFRIMKIYEAPVELHGPYTWYRSKGLCKYVVECNLGFCKKNKIKSGDCVSVQIV